MTVVWRQSRVMKHHIVMEHLIHKKCLAHTVAAINGNKFRTPTVVVASQFGYFLFASYNLTHSILILLILQI